MKIKPKKAYAVISKDRPKISVLDVFDTQDVKVGKDEIIIEVLITPTK